MNLLALKMTANPNPKGNEMKYSQAKRITLAILRSGGVPYLEGEPGLGKTALARDVANESFDGNVIYAPVPTMAREDWTGIPDVSGTMTTFKPMDWLPRADRDGDVGVLLIDELPQGDEGVLNGAARLLLERELHGYKLPKGWAVIATGNRSKDKAGCRPLPTHVRDRLTVVPLEADIDDWAAWAGQSGVDHRVVGYVRHRPDALQEFDPKAEVCPTARSWARLSNLLPHLEGKDYLPAFSGVVGEGRAAEFAGFLRIFDRLIPVSQVFDDPENCEVPEDTDVTIALVANIARRVSEDTIGAALVYGKRLGREFSVVLVRDILSRHPDLAETKEVCQYRADNADVELG